jgi:hypothetical protein
VIALKIVATTLAALAAAVSWTLIPWQVWRELHGPGAIVMLYLIGLIPGSTAWLAWKNRAAAVAAAALGYAVITLPLGSAVAGLLAVPARLLLSAMFVSVVAQSLEPRPPA